MKRVLVRVALLCAAAAPSSVAAQVELTPVLGLYIPVGTLIDADPANGEEERRHITAGLIAFRVAAWPARRFGVEGSVAFSPSQVAVSGSTGTVDVTAGVVFASARAVLSLSPPTALWNFHVGAGVGVVSRGGSAWENTEGTTTPALALAVGVRSRLGRSPIAIRIEVEDYMLSAQFDRGLAGETRARIHHDTMWSFGLTVPVFGKP